MAYRGIPPDPSGSAFQWAVRRSSEHRRTFWAATVLLGLVGTVGTNIAVDWPITASRVFNPTTGLYSTGTLTTAQRIGNGLTAFVASVAVVLVFVFVVALFRAPYEQRNRLRELHHQAVKEFEDHKASATQKSVIEPHFQELKRLVNAAKGDVEAKRAIADDSDRTALVAHFPELDELFQRWNTAIGLYDQRAEDLSSKMQTEALRFGVVPPFYRDDLPQRFLEFTRRRAERGEQHNPSGFRWINDPRSPLPSGRVTHVIHLDGLAGPVIFLEPPGLEPVDKDTAIGLAESLFKAAQEWSETFAYANREIDTDWESSRPALLAALQRLSERSHFKQGDGCPRCD